MNDTRKALEMKVRGWLSKWIDEHDLGGVTVGEVSAVLSAAPETSPGLRETWEAVKQACYGACSCNAFERDSGHRIDCWYPTYQNAAEQMDIALAAFEAPGLREALAIFISKEWDYPGQPCEAAYAFADRFLASAPAPQADVMMHDAIREAVARGRRDGFKVPEAPQAGPMCSCARITAPDCPMHGLGGTQPDHDFPGATAPAEPRLREWEPPLWPGEFYLDRIEDESGISGTGRVAQGFQFDDGTVALRWLTEHTSTAIYKDMGEVEAIHGHNGKTRIVRAALAAEPSHDGEEKKT